MLTNQKSVMTIQSLPSFAVVSVLNLYLEPFSEGIQQCDWVTMVTVQTPPSKTETSLNMNNKE